MTKKSGNSNTSNTSILTNSNFLAKEKFNFIDLFCGTGGFSLGFIKAGFEHEFGLDNWKVACEVYEKNIGKALCMDIKNFDGKLYKNKIDVVIGSPPCKTFSKANRKTRECDMTLTNEFFRIIKEIEPNVWIMENVPDIFPYIKAPFKTIFEMSEYGLLQNRKRCFASNVQLNLKKEKHKYLNSLKVTKQLSFRLKAIHNLFQTITCRYNSFAQTDPHIKDKFGVRTLSHTEALQIQTFPFNFKLPNTTQRETENLIGNAVPPLFAYKIGLFVKGELTCKKILKLC